MMKRIKEITSASDDQLRSEKTIMTCKKRVIARYEAIPNYKERPCIATQ